MIEVENLVKRYGSAFALHIPFLRIEEGASLGLVGNNGAGKTTFLRLVLDLIRADAGQVRIDGQNVANRVDWKAHTGAYLDEAFLLDFLTADEFFDFVGSIYGLSKREVQAALDPYRAFFTDRVLGESAKYIRDLSKGNAKKVGLVAALFIQPRLLILDEPFANLDPGSQIQLKIMLRQMNEIYGTTMIVSSHDLVHVTEVCRRVTLLDEGQFVRDETTSEATREELELYFATRMA